MFDTIRKEGNKEYYKRADGKIVFRFADDTQGYREAELLPAVLEELNRARALHRYPKKATIDTIITYQGENPRKAVNYVRYRLLGECGYMDVYGENIQQDTRQYQADEKITQLEQQINKLFAILEEINGKL